MRVGIRVRVGVRVHVGVWARENKRESTTRTRGHKKGTVVVFNVFRGTDS